MKLILEVSRKTFAEYKTHVINSIEDDYYSQPHGNGTLVQRLDDKRPRLNIDLDFINNEAYFPFNCKWKNMGLYVTYKRGYIIDHEKKLYAYNTCGGNTHGVYEANGKYFAFFGGSRQALTMPMLQKEEWNLKPTFIETNAPADMAWHERLQDYLIRKGAEFTAQYLVKRYGYWDHPEFSNSERYAINELSEDLVKKLVDELTFSSPERAEQYLLNKYRWKKFPKPSQLNGLDRNAWQRLDAETQERILKYA